MAVPFIARLVTSLARKVDVPVAGRAGSTIERLRKIKNPAVVKELKFIESQARRAVSNEASRIRTGKTTHGVDVTIDPSERHKVDPWKVVEKIVDGQSAAEAAREALTPAVRLDVNFITAGGRSQPRVLKGSEALHKAKELGEFMRELTRLRDFRNLTPRVRQSLAQKYGLTVDDVTQVAHDMYGFPVEYETVEEMARKRELPETKRMVDPSHSAKKHRKQLMSDLAGGNLLTSNLLKSLTNSGVLAASPRVALDIYEAVESKTLAGIVEFFETGVMGNRYEYLSSDQHTVAMNLTKMVKAAGLNPKDYSHEELNI